MIPVFDLGNVLLDWDPRFLYRKLIPDAAAMEDFLGRVCTRDWHLTLDAGKPFDQAIAERCAAFPAQRALIEAYRDRWNETIAGSIPGTVALLEQLHASGSRLYAISNFSAEAFEMTRPLYPFLDWFDGLVISGREGLVKPDAAIYRLLLERYGLRAEECLFIDDVERNIQGARAVGMQAVLFTNPEQLALDLRHYGLLPA